ncbi:uncharacterized protein LOC123307889 isoform X2 [Coccinella septempunctata]|nr:uncharacterized protein LOC123307889 isoform X2 [Coccinella septempunctata]
MFIAYHLLVMKNSENFIALSFLWITVAECTCQLSLLGQHYIDMAEDFLFTLTRCKWYKWSNYNKKSYLLFLIYAQNYKIVCVGGFIPYNLSLAIWMSRKTMSALTFFRAVRRIDNVA